MLVGHPVFYRKGMNRSDLFRAIVAAKVEPPENITYEALDLIGALLKRDPAKRLGSRQGGESEIIAHPWFKGIDFHSLFLRTMKAPYIPKIKDNFDVSCFPSWDHVEDKRKKQYPELTDAQNDFFKSF
jgi:serine/threonine protein kinase